MHMYCAILVCLLSLSFRVHGHIRLTFPAPRNINPGIKSYPCGVDAFWGAGQPTTDLTPGPLNITWEETINHNGAGFRIALSPNDDLSYNSYVLYDHIPHNDLQSLSKFYRFEVTIPNIDCPKCSIQIVNPMTDKLVAPATCCTYPNDPTGNQINPSTVKCFSVYHTCANVRILGTIPLSQFSYTYTGPCGPYNANSGTWFQDASQANYYNLQDAANYPSTLNNTCAGWQRSCTPPIPISSTRPIDLQAGGFDNSIEIASGLVLHWKTPGATDTQITMALRATANAWLGVGWTDGRYQMIGAQAVIGQVKNGVPTVMFYDLNSESVPGVVPAPIPLYNSVGEYISGVTTITFTRDMASGKYPISANGTSTVIGAIGPGPDLAQHTVFAQSATQINFLTGQAVRLPVQNAARDAHATFMVLAWGMILPFGVLFARYGKALPNSLWFTVHQVAQIGGTCMAWIGFFIAIGMVQGSHFKTVWHGQFGMFIMVWGLVQLFVGIFRPHKPDSEHEKKSPARRIFEHAHPWSGRLLLLFAIVQIFGGMAVRGTPAGWVALFIIILVGVVGAIIFLEVRTCREQGIDSEL